MAHHPLMPAGIGTRNPTCQPPRGRSAGGLRRIGRAILLASLPLVAIGGFSTSPGEAAAVNPLPIIANAFSAVNRYQVVISQTSNGTRTRPSGTGTPKRTPGQFRGTGQGFGFGPQTRTIVSVRKSGYFEELITITGKGRTGKTTTSTAIAYNTRLCTRTGTSGSYSCQTVQDPYLYDPTAALLRGVGMTNFTRAGSKTVNSRACDGYRYSSNSQFGTSTATVYIDHQTGLLCQQIMTTTRHFSAASPAFTQTTTSVWSHFNDKSLAVPAVP